MTYEEVLDYLFNQLPMYQRVGKAAYKTDLDNTINLCNLLGNPEKEFTCIHIAGTNGKGSTAHLLTSVFQEAGYKTGLYTSPHLKDYRERIKINGQCIEKDYVVNFIEQYKNDFQSMELSFFEMTVGLAFQYFLDQKTDAVILEAGLGGRLDSTNVVRPELSIITNIGHDHMNLLGDSLEKIATEKAGIIKPNVPVVIGKKQIETRTVFELKAKEHCAKLHYAQDFRKCPFDSALLGMYQEENQQTVWAAIQVLQEKFILTKEHIASGFKNVVENTGLLGRWQILQESPKVICDVAHNREGLSIVLKQLMQEKFDRLHIVLAVVNDKKLEGILPLFPKNAIYYFSQAQIPRAVETEKLQEQASEYELTGNAYSNIQTAYKAALNAAQARDLLFVGGSIFTVAEVL